MCKTVGQTYPTTHSITAIEQRERVLLWTMRAWVIGITQKIPVEEQIEDAFRRIGAPDATGQLYGLMWILSQGACRMLDVDCVCAKTVSGDERTLLDILALSQQGRTFEAMILLRTMVKSTRALAVADCASSLVQALSAAGFALPVRTLETNRYAFAGSIQAGALASPPTYH
jgi:hypothetical protein